MADISSAARIALITTPWRHGFRRPAAAAKFFVLRRWPARWPQRGKRHGSVIVSAKRAGSTMTISVVSNAQVSKFPERRWSRANIRFPIRAVGYELPRPHGGKWR